MHADASGILFRIQFEGKHATLVGQTEVHRSALLLTGSCVAGARCACFTAEADSGVYSEGRIHK